ncbi:MAG TPA: pyruvate kinase [Holophagaceae bacterium]|nr:pyruvate kinase [Holophagaceae bacterium]
MRKTKLVITFGPALMEGDRLREILCFADAIRLNASHGDAASRTEALALIRATAAELKRDVAVLLDLQGPKWRVGLFEGQLAFPAGAFGAFHPAGQPAPSGGFAWTAPLPHPELFAGARAGQRWLLDDGALEIEVVEALPDRIEARVLVGGVLKPRKGIHPIGLDVSLDPLTPKDLEDAAWGVQHGVDLFAQSFVRRASDVRQLQALIRKHGGNQPIIAKIEHPAALGNLEEILEASWGVMVARGDLGVELGVERVPTLQKQIIEAARAALKPVITATQMLESMLENPQPTRAESSDVANAIWDGTDAVMLSAESASGKYPVEAVKWLDRIAVEADAAHRRRPMPSETLERAAGRTEVAVAFAACRVASELKARWIVAFTEGGGTARMVSRLAGSVPVLGATTDDVTARRMGLLRGVSPLIIPRVQSTDEMVEAVRALLQSRQDLVPGDRVVMTMGLPLWKTGTTNTMKVMTF